MDGSLALTKRFFQQIGRSLLICHSSFIRHQGSCSVLPLTISTFFGDMFSLPDTNVVPFPNEQIDLDEPAEVIERALHGLYSAHMNDIALRTQTPSLEVLHATVKFHDKFNMDMGREPAEAALHCGIKRDPIAAFAYASRHKDVALARQAIRLIRFGTEQSGLIDLWSIMADAKTSWQLALAKMVTPLFKYDYSCNGYRYNTLHTLDNHCSSSHVYLETRYEIDMDEVAAKFDPQ
jgi:hypothetical protein